MQLEHMPTTRPYWIVITQDSRIIPGDERSRTAPGHGYPEHKEYFKRVECFDSEVTMKAHVASIAFPKFGMPKKYWAFRVNPLTFTMNIDYETAEVVL